MLLFMLKYYKHLQTIFKPSSIHGPLVLAREKEREYCLF